jgi:hypothetical protein
METTFIRDGDAWKGRVNNYNQRADSSITDESPLERYEGMDGE